jgi:hypothetical protein
LDERSRFLANSGWHILYELLDNHWDWLRQDARKLSTNLANWLSATSALIIPLWNFNFRPKHWRYENSVDSAEAERRFWRTLTAVSMIYLVVGTFWFQHWYVLWVLAPAVLIPTSRFTRTVLPWLVFGALSSNVAMSYLLATILESAPRIVKYSTVVGIIWGPLLIALSVYLLRNQFKKRRPTLRVQHPSG